MQPTGRAAGRPAAGVPALLACPPPEGESEDELGLWQPTIAPPASSSWMFSKAGAPGLQHGHSPQRAWPFRCGSASAGSVGGGDSSCILHGAQSADSRGEQISSLSMRRNAFLHSPVLDSTDADDPDPSPISSRTVSTDGEASGRQPTAGSNKDGGGSMNTCAAFTRARASNRQQAGSPVCHGSAAGLGGRVASMLPAPPAAQEGESSCLGWLHATQQPVSGNQRAYQWHGEQQQQQQQLAAWQIGNPVQRCTTPDLSSLAGVTSNSRSSMAATGQAQAFNNHTASAAGSCATPHPCFSQRHSVSSHVAGHGALLQQQQQVAHSSPSLHWHRAFLSSHLGFDTTVLVERVAAGEAPLGVVLLEQ